MKPSWDDAPWWANWLAMDGDGFWNWYETEPVWAEEELFWDSLDRQQIAYIQDVINPEETLEPRP